MMKSVFTDAYKVLLQHLISARKSANITQQELANRLRKPQSFVSKYENGERRLDIIEFLIISRHIGIDPYQLIQQIEAILSNNTTEDI